ncbi:UNVERIFIED_CONTAM: hypothetical protein Slati_4040300 [Sesamum latifolium]|uniref:CCHC-type domain-containing protein n=1 Tax=Sesamum latifolium TaxID=2727402 RepID=A0AAW2TS07_9LAMI
MDSGLGNLGATLSLTEEEESGWVLPTGVWHAEPLSTGFFVVGRLVSTKPFHPKALHTFLKAAFNPGRGLEFKLLEGGRFLLKFFHPLHRDRVIARCPWAYDKNLLVLAPVEASDDPLSIDLNCCDFHVHIHGLPLGKMTKEIASFISNRLGRFKEVELDKNGEAWGSSVHIRVALDITKSLRRALKIRTILGDEQLISFTYERLPNFCYHCGCLGHLSRQCDLQFQAGFTDPGENTPFGNWLRAAAPQVGRGRSGGIPGRAAPSLPLHPVFLSRSSLQSQPPASPPRRGPAIFGDFVNQAPNVAPPGDVPDLIPTSVDSHFLPPHLPNDTLHSPSRPQLTDLNLSPMIPELHPLPTLPLQKSTLIPATAHNPSLTGGNSSTVSPPTSSVLGPQPARAISPIKSMHSPTLHTRPQPSLKKLPIRSKKVLSQKRHLVDENSGDELETQGPSKTCKVVSVPPLQDVSNFEAAAAGQPRRSL